MDRVLCFDIGGTAIKYGFVTEGGEIIEKKEIPSFQERDAENPVASAVIGIIKQYVAKGTKLQGVAISTAGIVNSESGEVISMGPTIPHYEGTNFKKIVREKFSLPCEVENDVNCAGLAECISGNAKGADSCVCVTIGTGIGGCVICGGSLWSGHSFSAGEVGYIPMHGKVFQDLASTTSLVRSVEAQKNESAERWNGRKIFEAAENGDEVCVQAIAKLCENLGEGLAAICCVYNPEVVLIGGGISAQEKILYPGVRAAMDKYLLHSIAARTELRFAKYKNNAGMLGAYYNYLQKQKGTIYKNDH